MSSIVESQAVGGNMLRQVFVRFNPHDFSVGGVKMGHRTSQASRHARLIADLKNPTSRIYTSGNQDAPLRILHYFYDAPSHDAVAPHCVEEYGALADCVVPPVTHVNLATKGG